MNRYFYATALAATAAGAGTVAWVASSHLHGNPLALGMTLLIAAFYAWGVLELWRFHQATLGLQQALDQLDALDPLGTRGTRGTPAATEAAAPPARLEDWLVRVPAALRGAVRLRVEDERGALPGPALAPYLAGLLVLLGMLGTFLGMVVTLNGTGLALERATDVQTMRDSLAAPVRGLGLAFGTSVAGVAASAMLGLVSALCRRSRAAVALALDGHIAGALQAFTRAHLLRRQQAEQQQLQQAAFALQQQQAEQLPLLVASLQGLAASMGQQLQASLAAGARQAGDTLAALQAAVHHELQTAVQATTGGITRDTAALHAHLTAAVQQQLDSMAQQFQQQAAATVASLGAQAQAQGSAWLQALASEQAQQQARQQASDEARMAAFSSALAQLATGLAQNNAALGAQLEAQARCTVDEVARLAQSAAEAPRAAAEVVAQLRSQLSASLVQDQALLEERSRTLDTLNTLLGVVQHTTTAQKAAIDELVAGSARWLQEAGTRLTAQASADSARLEAASTQLAASAVDVASLGEAFGSAVQDFGHNSQHLLAHLQRLDETLVRAGARSDEQLAYYVAQAREVIDLSLLSQKQIVDDLQHLARRSQQEAAPTATTTTALGADA